MTLAEILRTAHSSKKKLLIVVGDGIDPVLELHDRLITKPTDVSHRYNRRLKELDKENWRYLEHVRAYTTNVLPIASYFFIFLLARLNLIAAIVTTNYDMYLDTIFLNLSGELKSPVVFNPILDPGEEDFTGYCAPKAPSDAIRIWKIHGSLSHIIFRNCKSLFPCPNYVLPFDTSGITDRFTHPISHLYLPDNVSCCPIMEKPEDLSAPLCGHYVHPIDWNLPDFSDLHIFKRIIDGGLKEFYKIPFAILILGFKGLLYTSKKKRSEEINLAAEYLDGKGVHWAMYVSPKQYTKVKSSMPHAHLTNLVEKNDGTFLYAPPDQIAKELMLSLNSAGLITVKECSEYFDDTFRPLFIERGYYEKQLNPRGTP